MTDKVDDVPALKDPRFSVPSEILNDDDTLRLTKGVRQALLAAELLDGVPDVKSRRRVMDLLTHMDESALTSKKIDVDADANNSDAEAFRILQAMRASMGNVNIYANANPTKTIPVADTNSLPTPNAVSGEMDIGESELTYSEFVAKQLQESEE